MLSFLLAKGQDTVTVGVAKDPVFTAPLASKNDSAKTIVVERPKEGMRLKFNSDGSKYVSFNLWNQIWIRNIEHNPGTLVNGIEQHNTWDVSVRRVGLRMIASLSSNYMVVIQTGMNNQSFNTGGTSASAAGKKPSFFIQDAYSEFIIKPAVDKLTQRPNDFYLSMGAGLHGWNGISRLSSPSTTSTITADVPGFNWASIEVADQFGRQLGIFAKGMYKQLAYRMHVNKPFAMNLTPSLGGGAVDNNQSGNPSLGGYFNYQFGAPKDLTTSFFPGTYLGSKKVINIGAGFYYNKAGTRSQPQKEVFKNHNIRILAFDFFYDSPIRFLKRGMSLSFNSTFYAYNFGPNYLRSSSIMNPGTINPAFEGKTAAEGPGNAVFLMGTGNISYTQVGFVLPRFTSAFQLQPFISYTYKVMKALKQPGNYYNIGTAFLIDGHKAKIVVEYASRPLYDSQTSLVFRRAGEFLVMLQVAL